MNEELQAFVAAIYHELPAKIDAIRTSQDRIEKCLIGDKAMGQIGLVEKGEKMEVRVIALENDKTAFTGGWKMAVTMGGIAVGVSAIVGTIVLVVK